MLAQCELRHTVGVELHAGGMLLSIVYCGRRCSAAAEVFEEVSAVRIRRFVPSMEGAAALFFIKHVSRVAVCGTQRLLRCVSHSHYPFLCVGDC